MSTSGVNYKLLLIYDLQQKLKLFLLIRVLVTC